MNKQQIDIVVANAYYIASALAIVTFALVRIFPNVKAFTWAAGIFNTFGLHADNVAKVLTSASAPVAGKSLPPPASRGFASVRVLLFTWMTGAVIVGCSWLQTHPSVVKGGEDAVACVIAHAIEGSSIAETAIACGIPAAEVAVTLLEHPQAKDPKVQASKAHAEAATLHAAMMSLPADAGH